MNSSVLIVIYNQSEYIGQAIENVLMQKKCEGFEIILLDDSSTDDTFEGTSELLSGKEFSNLINNSQNLGITRNYNKGFSLYTGSQRHHFYNML